jgi:kynurenine formamidase
MGKYAELRQRKQDLEQELKDINAVLKTQNEVILATFDARSIQKMHIKNVGLFYRQESPHPAVVNKEEFIKWLDGHGEGEIAVRTVNFQTLRKWWKEQMEHGAPLPPEELAKAFIDRSIRVRKG